MTPTSPIMLPRGDLTSWGLNTKIAEVAMGIAVVEDSLLAILFTHTVQVSEAMQLSSTGNSWE